MAPEYSKAALGLHPLVPLYAVDCDASKNKRLCADQGVQGFPTVKVRLPLSDLYNYYLIYTYECYIIVIPSRKRHGTCTIPRSSEIR